MANIVYTYITKLSAVEKHRYLYLCRMHNIFFLQIDTSNTVLVTPPHWPNCFYNQNKQHMHFYR